MKLQNDLLQASEYILQLEGQVHQANINSLSILKQLKQYEDDFAKKVTKMTEDMQKQIKKAQDDAETRI